MATRTLADRERMADIRRGLGLTQVDLARAATCTKQFINKLERGRSQVCSVGIAHAIEEALKVVAGSLFVPATSGGTVEKIRRSATSRQAGGRSG